MKKLVCLSIILFILPLSSFAENKGTFGDIVKLNDLYLYSLPVGKDVDRFIEEEDEREKELRFLHYLLPILGTEDYRVYLFSQEDYIMTTSEATEEPEGTIIVEGDVVIDGETTVEGDVVVDGEATVEGDVVVDGEVTTDGEATVEGEVTTEGEVTVETPAPTEETTTVPETAPKVTTIGFTAPIEGTTATEEELNTLNEGLANMVGYFVNGFTYSITFEDGLITAVSVDPVAAASDVTASEPTYFQQFGKNMAMVTAKYEQGLPISEADHTTMYNADNITGTVNVICPEPDLPREIVSLMLKKAYYEYSLDIEETETIEGTGWLTSIDEAFFMKGHDEGELEKVFLQVSSHMKLDNYGGPKLELDIREEYYHINHDFVRYLSGIRF